MTFAPERLRSVGSVRKVNNEPIPYQEGKMVVRGRSIGALHGHVAVNSV